MAVASPTAALAAVSKAIWSNPTGTLHEEQDAPRVLAERLGLSLGQIDVLGDDIHGVGAGGARCFRLGADVDGSEDVVRQFGGGPPNQLQQIGLEISHGNSPPAWRGKRNCGRPMRRDCRSLAWALSTQRPNTVWRRGAWRVSIPSRVTAGPVHGPLRPSCSAMRRGVRRGADLAREKGHAMAILKIANLGNPILRIPVRAREEHPGAGDSALDRRHGRDHARIPWCGPRGPAGSPHPSRS